MNKTTRADGIFARELDSVERAVVYAMLPGGFSIPTPVGNYNPDWAVTFKDGTVKYVYFVAETNGAMSEMQPREIGKAKIACAGKIFLVLDEKNTKYHVTYKQVASYRDLLGKVK